VENLNEAEVDENKPDESTEEAVVAESDAETPQSAEAEEEFEIDLGTDDQTSDKTVPLHKLQKLRKRAQGAEGKVKEKVEENTNLKAEIAELRQQVNQISRGPRPEPYDFATTEEFYAALDAWQGNTPVVTPQPESKPAQQPVYQVNDGVFDEHYERASKLPVKDYIDAEKKVRDELTENFGDAGSTLADYVINESGDKSHLVAYALGKDGKRLNALISKINADAKNGTKTTDRYLWELSQKVDIKPKKSVVSTNPEEIPEGAGNADALQTQIKQAYDKWAAEPSLENNRKLQELRAKQNG
jgi:hypothetical protein